MQLSAGTLLGPYEIVGALGAGGMGEVYRAKDTRIGREVAIKILTATASGAPDRLRRFEVEARATARISHPNVLTIHDVGTHEGVLFLVSELLEGETLRDRLRRGALARRKIVEYGVQMAQGLAAAHAQGVVHRDLKPENLFICRDGRVKVLDFGLARVLEAEAGEVIDSESATVPLRTAPGVVMGTAGYMSPEQVRAQASDHRSDIFSLGAVLWEMLTGERAFRRETTLETMNAILKDDPTLGFESRWNVEPALAGILRHCLEKNPGERFQSAQDLAFSLQMAGREEPVRPAQAGTRAWRVKAAVAAGVVAALLGALILSRWFASSRETGGPIRFIPLATANTEEVEPAWSPDGRSVAYSARADDVFQIFTRTLDSPDAAKITDSKLDCSQPFWSPDGTRIYYLSDRQVWAVGATGGVPRAVVSEVVLRPGAPTAAISPDGRTIAFFRVAGARAVLSTVPASGGKVQPYTPAPFPESVRFPQALRFSPDGKHLLALVVTEIGPAATVAFWKLPYPAGVPKRIPVRVLPARTSGASWFPDSRRFLIATVLRNGAGNHLFSIDSDSGAMQPLTTGIGQEQHPSISPDGARVAFSSGSSNWDLLEIQMDGSGVRELLATSLSEQFPIWAPDGRQYAYVSNANGTPELWLRSTQENWSRRLASGDSETGVERASFSPDGQRVAYVQVGLKHLIRISNLSGGRTVPLENESTDQHGPAWSPDGNSIAYSRFMNGQWEIAKVASDGSGTPLRLTVGGTNASSLEWSRSGTTICFTDPGGVYTVAAAGGVRRLLRKTGEAYIASSRDGAHLFVLERRRDEGRRSWWLVTLRLSDAAETTAVRLPFAPEFEVRGFSLHPDGLRLALSGGVPKWDIWMREAPPI